MLIRMMYVLPMILGRTFHVGKNTVGIDIFKTEDVKNPRVITESFYRSSYKTVETSSDVKDILEINGDLSLNIKAGFLSVRGFGAYVKSALRAENSVDVLTKVSYRTVSKSLGQSARPIADWKHFRKDYLGTHFVKSVLYGGDLIACIRFKAMNAEDLQGIRATIKTSLEGGSALDLVGEGKLESLDLKLKKKATMEINYFATVPLEGVPNNIKGLRDLVRGFENHVTKVNGGIGVPVEVELSELSNFDRGFEYIKNTELQTALEFLEEFFDDLLNTKSRLKKWVEEFPDPFTSEQQKLISDFSERVTKVLRVFITTIGNLDLEKGSSQLDDAKNAFQEGKASGMAGKFQRDLNRLFKKIVSKFDYSDKYSSVYEQYGSSKCDVDKSTVTLYSGYVASSPRNQIGGGLTYLCMPMEPDTKISDDDSEIKHSSLMVGVKYGLMETNPNRYESDKSVLRGVSCAMCLVERHSVVTFPGEIDCPDKGAWKLQYTGYMMSVTDTERAVNVCVDQKREYVESNFMGQHDQSLNYVVKKQSDERYTFIPCVVCSK